MPSTLGFRELASRLIHRLNAMVERGEVTERSLARLTGYSQPHVHNVLKGLRGINLPFADAALRSLAIPLLSLFTEDELGGTATAQMGAAVPVPLMAGTLGAGRPFPRIATGPLVMMFPPELAGALTGAAAAIIDESEYAMAPLINPRDTVLLDRSPEVRRKPVFENVYALCLKGKGYLGRCSMVGDSLYVATDQMPPKHAIEKPLRIRGRNTLAIVRGRIAWVGHSLSGD